MTRFVTRFKPDDINALTPRDYDALAWEILNGRTLDDLNASLAAFTFRDARGPFACFGAHRWDDRTAVAWCLVGARARRHARWLYVTLRRIVDREMAARGVTRLEAVIDDRHPYATKFVRNLGFIYEGAAFRYFPDDHDGDRYVYLRST